MFTVDESMEIIRQKLNESFDAHRIYDDDPYCRGCGAPVKRTRQGVSTHHLTDVVLSVMRSVDG